MARGAKAVLRPAAAAAYLLEVLQVSEIFDTLETVKEGCDELFGIELLLELLGELELLGLALDEAEEAL